MQKTTDIKNKQANKNSTNFCLQLFNLRNLQQKFCATKALCKKNSFSDVFFT